MAEGAPVFCLSQSNLPCLASSRSDIVRPPAARSKSTHGEADMSHISRVLVVSGLEIFREGLRSIIESQPGYQVVGEAAEVREACELLDRVKFDLLVTDLRLPGTWGLALVSEMRRRHNAQPALLLATECTPRFVAEALAAHCSGVVLTSAPRWVIAEAVVRVAKGLRYIYPSFSEHELRPAEQSELRPISTLSAREREVFEL
ncbi:MAG TPA: response regulator transcription factor, partial [Vicinamibacterales bacterium]|nr:response regulator transcription factor [Vicinamibacterales bacterium]